MAYSPLPLSLLKRVLRVFVLPGCILRISESELLQQTELAVVDLVLNDPPVRVKVEDIAGWHRIALACRRIRAKDAVIRSSSPAS